MSQGDSKISGKSSRCSLILIVLNVSVGFTFNDYKIFVLIITLIKMRENDRKVQNPH